MLVNNEMICISLSRTTLTNSSFRHMILHGSRFVQAQLINSDFSWSRADPYSCGDSNLIGIIRFGLR